jgi:hypothetical protein
MKHLASIGFLTFVLGGTLLAQQASDIHQQTTSPPNARFEIVQSELAAKWTFRLDRFTGHVAQLVSTKGGENTWEDMQVVGLGPVRSPTQARFQLFTSGLAAKHTFMIDTDSGNTWVIVASKRKQSDGTENEVSVWQPFVE